MWSLFEGIVCLHYAYHFCPTETVSLCACAHKIMKRVYGTPSHSCCFRNMIHCMSPLKLGSHCRSDQLDLKAIGNRSGKWSGWSAHRSGFLYNYFWLSKKSSSDRVAMRSRSDREVIGYWSSRGRVVLHCIVLHKDFLTWPSKKNFKVHRKINTKNKDNVKKKKH